MTNKDAFLFKTNFSICVGSKCSTNASDFKGIKNMGPNQMVALCIEYGLFSKEKILDILKLKESEIEAEFFMRKKQMKGWQEIALKNIEDCTVRSIIWKNKWRYVVNRLLSHDFVIASSDVEFNVDLWMIRGLLKFYIADLTLGKAEIESRIDIIKLKNIDFFKQEIVRKPIIIDEAF